MQTLTEDRDVRRNRALGGESRVRILEALRPGRRPRDASELAPLVGLHVSTIRFHLQALEEAGLIERRVERLGRPGRPRVAYRAIATEDPSERAQRYLLLSRILAASLAGRVQDPAALAREAGEAWGRSMAEERGTPVPLSTEAAMQALAAMLDELGFSPEIEVTGPGRSISLHRCPFREIAEENPQVVCSVHLGLMRGALSQWRSPLRADELEPFVEPDRCVARFSERGRRPKAR